MKLSDVGGSDGGTDIGVTGDAAAMVVMVFPKVHVLPKVHMQLANQKRGL